MSDPRLCYYCDRPGVFDANEETDYAPEEITEPLTSYDDGVGDVAFLHPSCFAAMTSAESCA